MEIDEGAVGAIRDLAAGVLLPRSFDGNDIHQYALVPKDYKVESLEQFQMRPNRIKGKVKLIDVESFIHYISRFMTHNSLVFATAATDLNPSFSAILNYSGQGDPKWCDHIAHYPCPKTEEWQRWMGMNGTRMTQWKYAEFMEDNAKDIVAPVSAEMIEIAKSLSGKKEVVFNSGVRTKDGSVAFTYNETVQGKTSGGQMEIPETFSIGVAPFYHGSTYRVEVRFKYRIEEGKLSMWYEIVNPHLVLESAFDEIVGKVRIDTGLPVLFGSA